jgi:hypothetical protein
MWFSKPKNHEGHMSKDQPPPDWNEAAERLRAELRAEAMREAMLDARYPSRRRWRELNRAFPTSTWVWAIFILAVVLFLSCGGLMVWSWFRYAV